MPLAPALALFDFQIHVIRSLLFLSIFEYVTDLGHHIVIRF